MYNLTYSQTKRLYKMESWARVRLYWQIIRKYLSEVTGDPYGHDWQFSQMNIMVLPRYMRYRDSLSPLFA